VRQCLIVVLKMVFDLSPELGQSIEQMVDAIVVRDWVRMGRTLSNAVGIDRSQQETTTAHTGDFRCDTRSHTMSEHTEEVDTVSSV
jgi:hypothetical protein